MAASMSNSRMFLKLHSASNSLVFSLTRSAPAKNLSSASSRNRNDDPGELFLRRDIQRRLQKMTGFSVDKIFTEQLTKVKPPKYKLMTDAEVEKAQADTIRRGRWKLQMPPVMKARTKEEVVIANDPDIEGYETHKVVFTDITYGVKDKTRTIVVREPCGKLRHADSDERDRLLNVYFPQAGRMYHTPQMFTEPYLENLLQEGKFVYLLDRAGIQFEPDSHNYIRVCDRTYEYINQHQLFDQLRSTRHFGPMAFYLAINNKIDNLVVDMIQRDLLTDAADLIKVHGIIHRTPASARLGRTDPDVTPETLIQTYADNDSSQGGTIQLALQTYMETLNKVHNESL